MEEFEYKDITNQDLSELHQKAFDHKTKIEHLFLIESQKYLFKQITVENIKKIISDLRNNISVHLTKMDQLEEELLGKPYEDLVKLEKEISKIGSYNDLICNKISGHKSESKDECPKCGTHLEDKYSEENILYD